jgi:hypothetical protein
MKSLRSARRPKAIYFPYTKPACDICYELLQSNISKCDGRKYGIINYTKEGGLTSCEIFKFPTVDIQAAAAVNVVNNVYAIRLCFETEDHKRL